VNLLKRLLGIREPLVRTPMGLMTSAEVAAAEDRWRTKNAESRAAGCPCGEPATHVARLPVVGSVPFEVWSCEAHVGVNSWTHSPGDAHYTAWPDEGRDTYHLPPAVPAKP